MGLKQIIKNKLKRYEYANSQAYKNQMLLLGENLLSTKRLLWDSDKLPFVPSNWNEYGFKVFSQNNEDGLIQYIIQHTKINNKLFIEFGVEDYNECNTRFLLNHNCWKGLVIDGNINWMEALKQQEIYHNRLLNSKGAFIKKDNINTLFSEAGFTGDIGLLSVDIDGNDYWILDAINCIQPQILICEYNSIFGNKEKVSIPYKSDFYRGREHFSNVFYGASLGAFVYWANNHGYKLVCINDLGCNAFFVKRNDCDLPEVSIEDAWVRDSHRESRDENGKLTFLENNKAVELVYDMQVIDVETNEYKYVKDLKF